MRVPLLKQAIILFRDSERSMNDQPELAAVRSVPADELEALYSSVGWVAYTRDLPGLEQAIANSTYVVTARITGQLVGLARAVSDDVSIFYLQDILVRPDHQHRGIGRALARNCLNRFAHVRSRVLLTDDLPSQHRFYESMGYRDTRRITNIALHAFVQIDGVDLQTDSESDA